METKEALARILNVMSLESPLIQHVTNCVTIETCANTTLAINAKPVMTEDPADAEQMAEIAQALLINMGTVTEFSLKTMLAAGKVAKRRGIPIVFDPVGAGATSFRRSAATSILENTSPTIIKGNADEISFLAGYSIEQRGVDARDDHDHAERKKLALEAAKRWGTVIALTGKVDCISDGINCKIVEGGSAYMSRITGTGCSTGSVVASMAAVEPKAMTAACCGIYMMKKAGEEAQTKCGENFESGKFKAELLNALSSMRTRL